jgi:hypothetical protein
VARQDAVAEAGSKALDLPLDHARPVDHRPRRNVAIGVACVLVGRCPGVVELALLHEQHEGPFGMLSAPDGGFAGGDLAERAAEMNGRGFEAPGISPRDRPSSAQSSLKAPGP